jgi:hypothetical protein
MRGLAIVACAVAALGGCKKEPQIVGVGKWNVNTTTRADATGKCLPEQLSDGRAGSYCVGQAPMKIAGMTVEIDLYFAGNEPTAKLVEIQMKANACDEEGLLGWMRQTFGNPVDQLGSIRQYRNEQLYGFASIPLRDDPIRCVVRLIPAREKAHFEQYWERAKAL